MSHPLPRSSSPSSSVSTPAAEPALEDEGLPSTSITHVREKGPLSDKDDSNSTEPTDVALRSYREGSTSISVSTPDRPSNLLAKSALPPHWLALHNSIQATNDIDILPSTTAANGNSSRTLKPSPIFGFSDKDQRLARSHVLPPFISPVDSPAEVPSTPKESTFSRMAQKSEHSDDAVKQLPQETIQWCDQPGSETPWSITANRNEERSQNTGQVEKSIAASLTNAEPTARSRKTSHSLGLFKENTPSHDLKKSEERRDKSEKEASLNPIKEANHSDLSSSLNDSPLVIRSSSNPRTGGSDKSESSKYTQKPRYAGKTSHQGQHSSDSQATSTSLATGDALLASDISKDFKSEVYHVGTDNEAASSLRARHAPPDLLDEIRNHQKARADALTLSQSLPTTDSEVRKTRAERRSHRDEGSVDRSMCEDSQSPIEEVEEDGEESEHDEITSALYIPHQTPSAEGGSKPTAEGRLASEVQASDPNRQESKQDFISPKSSYEIDISLQAGGDESHLHGDLVNGPTTPSDENQALGIQRSELSYSSASESDYESFDEGSRQRRDETSLTDDLETTPTATPTAPAPIRRHKPRVPLNAQPQEYLPRPLNAVELKPYKHQVGGHTTVFRFSRRAVCKPLSNRENEFYETIERLHPEFLTFLPRYIGVLNVTFRKSSRRKKKKHTSVNEEEDSSKGGQQPEASELPDEKMRSARQQTQPDARLDSSTDVKPRLVSHSQQPIPTPRVIFANNRHIIPDYLFSSPSRRSDSKLDGSLVSGDPLPSSNNQLHPVDFNGRPTETSRPSLERHHHPSWGATSVNQQLQAQVLREVFSSPTIHQMKHHKYSRSQASLPKFNSDMGDSKEPKTRISSARELRRNSVDVRTTHNNGTKFHGSLPTPPYNANLPEEQLSPRTEDLSNDLQQTKSHTDSSTSSLSRQQSRKVRRRHSGMGLRRRRLTVDRDEKAELQYFEDDGYGGDREDGLFAMDDESAGKKVLPPIKNAPIVDEANLSKFTSSRRNTNTLPQMSSDSIADDGLETSQDNFDTDVPSNPKAAQIHPDERVEHFLLLEDVTAGMKRPCVLDLKMGTRQYGLDATEKKQKSQRQKGTSTTSRQLGVRVCGMQVWNAKDENYFYQDKYYGRDLKQGAEFQGALTRYFYNGLSFDNIIRHIPALLDKITALEAKIKSLRGYRFYASSLLVLYDGDAEGTSSLSTANQIPTHTSSDASPESKTNSAISVKIVDFANCVTAEDMIPDDTPCPPRDPNGVDKGFLRGLTSLKLYLRRIWSDTKSARQRNAGLGEGEGPPTPLEPYTDPANGGYDNDVSD